MKAPHDRKLRKAIQLLANSEFGFGVERYVFLGATGEVRDVVYPSQGLAAVRAHRANTIDTGELEAVVHLCVRKTNYGAWLNIVEMVNEPTDGPSVYGIISYPQTGTWVELGEEDLNRWNQNIDPEEGGSIE